MNIKTMAYFLFVFFGLLSLSSFAGEQTKLLKTDFTTWPKANVVKFGCFLEKEFGHKDKKFNCGLKDHVNNGDPCKNVEAYYAGPEFPLALVDKVNDKIESITLAWEDDRLQNVSVVLKSRYSEKKARKLFKLPNNSYTSVSNCGKNNTCISIQGFDHMGSGDVECGEE